MEITAKIQASTVQFVQRQQFCAVFCHIFKNQISMPDVNFPAPELTRDPAFPFRETPFSRPYRHVSSRIFPVENSNYRPGSCSSM